MKPETKMERGLTSEEVTSVDELGTGFEKSDGGDVLSPLSSQYSSCEESEFDRYCSANSVVGTPSVCSSMGFFHDSVESDFGSLNSLEGFIPRKYEGHTVSLLSRDSEFGDRLNEGCYELKDEGEGLSSVAGFEGKMEVLGNNNGELKRVKVFDGEVGKKEDLAVALKNVENVLMQGAVAARRAAEDLLDCNHADEMEDERCRELDETSSRCDHSEGEDSMFNYGSGDESQSRAYYVRNVGDRCHEDLGCGNSVLMNPSMAFGSNDWEDFELDGMENTMQLPDSFLSKQQSSGGNETNLPDQTLKRKTSNVNYLWHGEEINGRDDITTECCSTSSIYTSKNMESWATVGSGDSSGMCKQITCNDELDDYLEKCNVDSLFQKQSTPLHDMAKTGSMLDDSKRKSSGITSDTESGHDDRLVPQRCLDPQPSTGVVETSLASTDGHRDANLDVLQGEHVESPKVYAQDIASTCEAAEGRMQDESNPCGGQNKSNGNDFEMNAFYDEFVHEMEEILLESCDSSVTRLKQRNISFQLEDSSPLRDGESLACTSDYDDGNPLINHPLRIDSIEVVGTKQKKGDISFSERLVGVKEHTVYIVRVRSGNDQWEVERRYRDFDALYLQLKTYFAAREWNLPPVWSSVDKESRKFFGNTSPNVVAERTTLIQECLCSILQSRHYSSPPNALIWFLSPPEALLSSSQSNDVKLHSNVGAHTETVPSLGKTISLIVDKRSYKTVKELLDAQHYTCAGCHMHFDNVKSRMLEIAQTFGWGKPRFCEYTGQLFCSSCHTNETAVVPARVLHNWDFTPYPVSQMAKSYLDSIVDKPMLCVSAANPFLFSRVPPLLHVVGIRRKIGAMLPYIRCSFRRSIYRRLGYRKYLLEANDFFALRDLDDLSKGVFAALPAILEAVSKKIQEHITELCLECCDNGIPCGARQACDNPCSLIFPFQEEEIRRCKSCKSVYHMHCFNKVIECPCGAVLNGMDVDQSTIGKPAGISPSSSMVKKSDSLLSSGFLSGLFSISRQEKGRKENDNVILMGSLPSTSL
ncbi:Pleckstrin homology domain-containing family M member 3 [Bienertia sinuspersici]